MTLLRIHAPDLSEPILREVLPGAPLLIGRQPDASTLPPQLVARAGGPPLPVTIPSRLVSENHALAWSEGQDVRITDLGSTNGSQLAIPASRAVGSEATESVDLLLARTVESTGPKLEARDWTTVDEFRAALPAVVNQWLRTRGVRSRVAAMQLGADDKDPRANDIALGDGWVLRFDRDPNRFTNELGATRFISDIWSFVHDQRGLLDVDRDSLHDDGFVLVSQISRGVHRRICQAARRGLHGILQGESGVGKSAFARCFHIHSERRSGPFIETNLGEDSDDRKYFQLKLFGAKAGAAEGITRDRVGLVKAADGGTLFLDEIGLLPVEVQGMLLKFLDNGTFRRLGDSGDTPPQRANTRLVVGTNLDLRDAVRRGAFREDLWWRLSGIVIDVPPLRERREDVAAFLMRENIELRDQEVSLFSALTEDARALLLDRHRWPGNFRELRNFVGRLPLFLDNATVVSRAVCEEALRAGALDRGAADAPQTSTVPRPSPESWADLLGVAQRLLPAWLERKGIVDDSRFEFKLLFDEVLRPLCLARALGVEGWDELPRRPDPSFQQMAERMGYADGKSVQDGLRIYIELKRLARPKP
jgi:transcriptional regulator with AAA-type ATPase domain